jgi:hypothetical protein
MSARHRRHKSRSGPVFSLLAALLVGLALGALAFASDLTALRIAVGATALAAVISVLGAARSHRRLERLSARLNDVRLAARRDVDVYSVEIATLRWQLAEEIARSSAPPQIVVSTAPVPETPVASPSTSPASAMSYADVSAISRASVDPVRADVSRILVDVERLSAQVEMLRRQPMAFPEASASSEIPAEVPALRISADQPELTHVREIVVERAEPSPPKIVVDLTDLDAGPEPAADSSGQKSDGSVTHLGRVAG